MANPDLILLHAPSVYDFRKESILYGPVSDLVPSTPVFEMYPIGFTTMAEYLERAGLQTRIINLAVRMLDDANFDVESYSASWMPRPLASTCTGCLMPTARSKLPASSNACIPPARSSLAAFPPPISTPS